MGDPVTSIAIGAGVGLLSRLLNRSHKTTRVKNEAQRIEDIQAPASSYGFPIRDIFGQCRVSGCSMIWAKDLKEVISVTTDTQTQRQGKGGGSSQTTVTETETASYFMTAAFLIGGPVNELNKVWANGVQIYNKSNSNEIIDAWGNYTEVHLGGENQDRSATINDLYGNDGTPALRGCSYIVFKDYPIELFRGSSFPKIDVEVNGPFWDQGADRVNLSDCITTICNRAGIDNSQIDLTGLTPTVVMYGATFENNGETFATYIEDLATINGFDYRETGGKLRLYNRALSGTPKSIPTVDMGTRRYGEELPDLYKKTKPDPFAIPAEVRIEFLSRTKELERNNVGFRDPAATPSNSNSVRIGTRIVTNEADMMRTAARLLYEAKIESQSIEELYLPPAWSGLNVGDFISLQEKPVNRLYRITEVMIAEDYRVRIKAIGAKGANLYGGGGGYNPVSPPAPDVPTDYPTSGVGTIGTATTNPLDINMISDGDPEGVLYLALVGDANWKNGTVYMSRNAGASYEPIGSQASSTITGTVATTLPDQQGLQIAGTFRVSGVNGQISSVTQDKFDNNIGLLCLVGNEIIMARDAVLVDPGVYDISYLKRGVRGTEWATGHGAGERFVLLSSPLFRVVPTIGDIGNQLLFKAVGLYGSEPTVAPSSSITLAGASLEPYSPVEIQAVKDQAGNITITWKRRDRRAGFRTDYDNFPMSEASEKYDLVFTGGRTVELTAPNYFYSAADQITDFGSVQSTVTVSIYQISGVVDRGYVAIATLTPALGVLIPVIDAFSPTQGEIGAAITIYGSGFTGATGGAIGLIALTDFVVVDDNTITATVAETTITGKVKVTNATGTGESLADFAIVEPGEEWGTITGAIENQTDLWDVLSKTRIWSNLTVGRTLSNVGTPFQITVEKNYGFTEGIPIALFRGSNPVPGLGYAQLVVNSISVNGNGETDLIVERDDVGLVTETVFLAGDIVAPIIDRTVNIYGGLASKSQNIANISSITELTLGSAYFQYLTATVASVNVKLPLVTGTDYFECEIVNAGSGDNVIIIQENDGTNIATLSNQVATWALRSIYVYWDGSMWRVFERSYY